MSTKLTAEQAVILTGFTGVACGRFSDFQRDVERRLGRDVWTHEFASDAFADEIREMYRADFMELLP